MQSQRTEPPTLQAPGNGLPQTELIAARILVAWKRRITSHDAACRTFATEQQRISAIIANSDPKLATKRVLIKRLRGMEDSSRYWSLYMTVEHIRIVNRFTLDLLRSLQAGVAPDFVASTASVKPREDVGVEVVSRFEEDCEEFLRSFRTRNALSSTTTFTHPWFGELNARAWHFFAGFHMALHRRQLEKISESLSETDRQNEVD